MTYDVDAIYDGGVLRPLEPLALPDGVRVHLRVVDQNGAAAMSEELLAAERARRRVELDEFRRIVAELPVESPNDGFSGADHDQLLYGKP